MNAHRFLEKSWAVAGRSAPRRTLLALEEQRLEAFVVEEAGEEASALVIGTDQCVLGLPVAGCKLRCALQGTPAADLNA